MIWNETGVQDIGAGDAGESGAVVGERADGAF
jgi:hypothetical protein